MSNQFTFRELMLAPDKKRNKAENELAYLFRDMMLSHGINASEWDRRMDSYYRRSYTNEKGQVDIIRVNQEKSNLVRALAKDSLPWRRFNTSLQLMGAASYTITIDLHYLDGRTHTHKVKVRNRAADIISSAQLELKLDDNDGEEDE